MNESAHYIYHVVPPKMEGPTLYPLNQLRERNPAAYAAQVEKYKGREQLLERRIPILGCLWNDVLFLTAVHPAQMMAALRGAGYQRQNMLRSFQFDIQKLDIKKMAVMFERRGTPRTFEKFDPAHLEEYGIIPQDTLDHFREQKEKGNQFMFFGHVPHILYQGSLDTTGVPTVEG